MHLFFIRITHNLGINVVIFAQSLFTKSPKKSFVFQVNRDVCGESFDHFSKLAYHQIQRRLLPFFGIIALHKNARTGDIIFVGDNK